MFTSLTKGYTLDLMSYGYLSWAAHFPFNCFHEFHFVFFSKSTGKVGSTLQESIWQFHQVSG